MDETIDDYDISYANDAYKLLKKGYIVYKEYGYWAVGQTDNWAHWHGYHTYEGAMEKAMELAK